MKYSKAVYVTSHDILLYNLNRNYDVYTNRVHKNEEVYLATINYASKNFACQYDSNRDNSHDTKGNVNRQYNVFTNRVVQNEKDYLATNYAGKDFACQYDSNRDTVICTCKRTKREGYKYFNSSRQVYRSQRYTRERYTGARGFTDVGVGNVKSVPKKVRRIYLPDTEDRGVGSSDLTSFIRRTDNGPGSYYDQKKTSSKCVGGVMEYNIPVLNEKLSPICKTKSGSTSPKRTSFEENKNIDNHCIIPDPVVNIVMGRKHIRGDKINKEQGTTIPHETLAQTTQVDKRNEISVPNTSKWKSTPAAAVNEVKDFSSDSLVQHVHNLENPSSFKHSKTSIDSMIENKLEREYIKMFSQISKQDKPIAEVHPIKDSTSESLRRRFEALRRGLSKKEGSVEHGIVIKSNSLNSTLSRKDVSITSDPPSLEARSYMDAKMYSPLPFPLNKYEDVPQTSYRRSVTGKERSSRWSTYDVDSDCQDVKGMFKLWGKKFDFEENFYKKTSAYTTPDAPTKQKKKVELIIPKEEVIEPQKKEGKKFSFFKRKNKEREKQPYKSKKGVTAGRCEVGDGLTIRIGAANEFTPEPARTKTELIPDDYDGMLRRAWLKRCLDKKNDSSNSVKIRWNNEMYATSSSTVFELMECVYKNTGIIFTSRSEMSITTISTRTTAEFPSYHAKNQQVNFMQQAIQAWMIPKMMTDKSLEIQKRKNKKDIEVSFSDQKWFIDKSKAFSQKVELVLHSKNLVQNDAAKNSEYIVIDIPKGYFLESSSEDEQSQSSDEQVFNIVEYETAKSSSYYLNKQRNNRKMDTGDYENDIRVIVNVNQNEDKETNVLEKQIKTALLHRDVVVQGSNVYVPKRCDVISVGIITQHTHNRDIQQPILRMQDEMTDDESRHKILTQKKCELAESYLQDYYRHWVPLGMDLYSWCISDSNLRASSDNYSMNSFNNLGDGSKSCPNIYDDYQASAIVSSCTTSSHSHCMIIEDSKGDDTTTTYFNKLKKDDTQLAAAEGKRVLPKDSVEVFKRRKIYAASKVNADWCTNQGLEPLSKPSIFDKFAQKLSNESSCDQSNQNKKKIKKHVSLKDFKKIGESIMSFKGLLRCNKCKPQGPCSKHALVMPEPKCQMLPPPCLDTCTKKKKPPCLKEGPATCLVPPPPICPEGPPSPCQPACPPIPPPCASFLGESSALPPIMPPSSLSRSLSRFLPGRKKCSPPSSPQKPPSPPLPQNSPLQIPPTSPPPTKLSRFLSRYSKQKAPCIDSCSKQEKPPCSTKGSSPCATPPRSPRTSPPQSPRTSPSQSPRNTPPHLPPATTSSSKPRSFSRFFSGRSKEKPPCIDSCSKLKKPPCSTKDSSPCASLLQTNRLSPPDPTPDSTHPSNPHKKNSSQSSQQKPCQDSCSKLKKPPCFTKDSSPGVSSPPVSPPSSPRITVPSRHTPHRSKFSFSSSKQEIPCLESTKDANGKNTPCKTTKARCGCMPHPGGLPSLPGSHLRPTKSTPLSPPLNCLPPKSTLLCGCNSQKSCGLPNCLSRKKSPSPSQEFPFPPKNQLPPKNSGINLKKDPISKKNSSTTKIESGDCDLDCSRKVKQKKNEGSIPSIPLIPPLPVCQPSRPNPRSQSKISGLHLRKLPIPRNLSNESKLSCKVIRLNSKENLSIRTKPKTPSTEAIREGCNIKVQDEDGQTLYERRDYKIDTAQARKHLVQDMYRDSRIHRVSTTKANIINEKSLESCRIRSNTSLSNIVEINLNLKFKHTDKTTDVNIKKISDTPKDDENEKLDNQASKDVYTLQDKTNKSIDQIEDVEKRDVNIKIIINNYQQSANKSKRKIIHENLRADEEFSRKISEKFHTVSTGYSDVLDQQTFSVHRATVNFTNSADTSKVIIKPSEELLNEELIEKGPINLTDNEFDTELSKSEHLVTLVTSHTTKNEGSQLLPSVISQIKLSDTNLENTVDTFDEKSATDNEEALHSGVKLPKIRNKEENKKILKLIFEDSSNRKISPNKSKMKKIRKMLRAVLTSDSSAYEDDSLNHEVAKELAYESMKPNFFKDSASMTNYYQTDSSISDNISSMNEIEEILHPTEINNSLDSAESTNENSRCLCSHLAAKLNLCENNNLKACCCRGNAKRDEEIDCNLIEDLKANKAKYVDAETQDSNLKSKFKQPGVTIESTVVIQPHKVKDKKRRKLFSQMPKRLFSYSSSVKVCKLNRQTVLGLSDDDKVIILNSESAESKSPEDACTMKNANLNPIDILQLYETKKAVLEIYAEKTVSHTEEHLIAKLPKFIYETESGNINYEDMFADFHEFSAGISF